jgi:SAM-dependent methyltransferase
MQLPLEPQPKTPEMGLLQHRRPRSVVIGNDSAVLSVLLTVHATKDARVLDCTYNRGVMWKGLHHPKTTLDIDPQWGTDIVADFRAMPVDDASFDVLVFDPPHVPLHAATPGVYQREDLQGWRSRYGTAVDAGRGGDNVADLFEPFLREAKRVLRPDGVVFAKLVDLVHNHRYQWQHVEFIQAAQRGGMTPCDAIIKADPTSGNLQSGRWERIHHVRRSHCYWLVIRNSERCESRC